MNEPKHIDLFSGIGGFSLAASWAGFRTVAFVERELYCQKILAQHWPEVPVFGDIYEFDGKPFSGVELLTGGFPCQPFSQAGKRRGKEDDRYLWPEMLRVISEAKPHWVLGENVAGLDGLGLDDCISDLESIGYEVAPPLEIPACAVDARHVRNRIWIVANSTGKQNHGERRSCQFGRNTLGRNPEAAQCEYQTTNNDSTCRQSEALADAEIFDSRGLPIREKKEHSGLVVSRQALADSSSSGCQEFNVAGQPNGKGFNSRCVDAAWREWPVEPELGRVAYGIPNRTHRLKGLGNAIVPQVAFQILKEIRKLI